MTSEQYSQYDRIAPPVVDGIRTEMNQDEDVFLMGEDIGPFGGIFDSTEGLHEEFGDERVMETPISETGFIGAGVGAALAGFRPIVELMYVDFAGVAFDQIYNEMAKVCYMSGGSHNVPMVLMTAVGMTPYQDPTHTQTLYSTFSHHPGMKVVVPSSPYDAKGLMQSAIRDDNPVVYMFHKQLLLGMTDFADVGLEVPNEDYKVPIGEADIKRQGSDVTIATVGLHVQRALKAAEQLSEEGLDAEVLDLRTLVPLDEASVLDSVAKTNRLLVVDEDYQSFGLSGELIARVSEKQPESLNATARLATPDAPVPYSPPLKDAVVPNVEDIIQSARDLTT
jgi:pyruvate/2-oxoglutarate/acetoin dehydrogenase E1 component